MKIVIAGVAAAFVVVIGGMAGLGAYASGLETSMPGLSIKGIDVGKCSPEELRSKLSGLTAGDFGYDNLNITFPGENSFDITPAQAGLSNMSDVLAEGIYDLGKDGNVFSNAIVLFNPPHCP